MTAKAHYDAFRARMETVPQLAGKGHDGVRVNANGSAVRENYFVLFPSLPVSLESGRYSLPDSSESDARYVFDVRFVAVNATGLLVLADPGVAALLGHRLVVGGRNCTPIELDSRGAAVFDPVANLHYMDVAFEFWSYAA